MLSVLGCVDICGFELNRLYATVEVHRKTSAGLDPRQDGLIVDWCQMPIVTTLRTFGSLLP